MLNFCKIGGLCQKHSNFGGFLKVDVQNDLLPVTFSLLFKRRVRMQGLHRMHHGITHVNEITPSFQETSMEPLYV